MNMLYDAQTVQSTGAFLNGELERLDPTINRPLVSYTWSRDISLKENVQMGDEFTSFINSGFSVVGNPTTPGKNWIMPKTTEIPGISYDLSKTVNPLMLWGLGVSYSIIELQAAMQTGRPIDVEKVEGVQIKWNMDLDEMVYVGDTTVGATGLLNYATAGTTMNAAKTFKNSTADEILKEINALLTAVWEASAQAAIPNTLLLPPEQFAYIVTTPVTSAGSVSILNYIKQNNIVSAETNQGLNIFSCKWAKGLGNSNKDRMCAYNNDKRFVRIPVVPLQRTPVQFKELNQNAYYYGKIGVVESPYPTTIGYSDGI